MDIVSHCPLLTMTRPYRTVRGGRFVLVVCKGTFLLTPSTATLGGTQEPIHEDDKRWDDKADRSVYAPSDIVPFKRDVDVLLVGHAFAPAGQAARSIMTRLCVGDVDKSIEVFGDRLFTPHGELRDGPRITRARLRYERAVGGPGTSNPVGMRHDKKDLFGAISMASLQPPGLHVTRPEDLAEPVGYGPIAPEWPTRTSRLGHLAKTFSSARWYDAPLPDDLDPSYFNSAPPDQRLREVRPDERIVLEGLTAEQTRFVTQLPGLAPQAVVERMTGRRDPLQLRADTLWIDTSRRVCTVTWRANLALTQPSDAGRIVITLGAPETSRMFARLDPALLAMPMPSGKLESETISINLQGKSRPITPFDPQAIAAPDTADLPDDPALIDDEITFVQNDSAKSSTLPFVAALPFAAPPPAPPQPPRASSSSPGLPFVAAPAPHVPPPMAPPPMAPPPMAPPPMAPPPVPTRDLPFVTPAGASTKSTSGVFPAPGAPPPVFPVPPPVATAPSTPPPPVFPVQLPVTKAQSAPPPPVFPVQPSVTNAQSAPPPPVFPVQPPVATAASFAAVGATAGYPTLGKPLAPPVPSETVPEAPPMIGPLATPEMLGRPGGSTASDSTAAPAEEKPTPAAVAPPSSVDEDSIERCARITASIARRKDDRAKILDAEKLDAERFAMMQTRWNSAISAETDRGKTKLLQKFDDAYVERLEQERGAIRPEEFARLVVAAERGHPDATLRELGLPSSALMRIERVFLRRTASDLALAQRVLRAIEAERDA